ncbi:N-acetylglutamate synthase, GNAT family [Caloramator quimbayensis]|uniref:N-acetylglutamate synthase, GNAT family n=1 Tax=Caloramator quimbayensis TaxID=1147123 RepID=A0A1T4XU82_9CLOT|nr:GNAT family N-acetyltransferase [Caloramator quimbayensis]SKA92963.1 N-acetylglutamate synthase, GNAT family [Caloramator quimbayensis]
MDVLIREAIIEDYKNLSEIYEELDEYHRLNHPELFVKPNKIPRDKSYIQNIISDERKALFVAEIESKIVGLAECYILKPPNFGVFREREWVQLDSIVVKKEYQNLKIGTMLLEKVIEWAKGKGIDRIELKVYLFNENALNFYLEKGFKELSKVMYFDII